MKPSQRPTFVVGLDSDGWADPQPGIDWLLDRVDGDPLILVPQQSQLRDSLADLIGEDATRQLLKHGRVQLGRPVRTVFAATWRSFPPADWTGGPVLALWPDENALGKAEGLPQVTALCAVPWSHVDRIDAWARATGAVDLTRPGEPPRETPTIADPVVLVAMRGLTSSVNLSTGLMHPSDRTMAIETLRILQAGGHRWTPDELQTWARANGWDLEGSRQLGEYASGVHQGKRYRTERTLRPEALEMWRAEAGKDPR